MTCLAYIFGFSQGLDCYFNYNTSFGTMISIQDFYEMFHDGEVRNAVFCISEIQNYIDSHYGISKSGTDNLIMDIALQTRKADVTVMWDTQRKQNVHRVLNQQTDYYLESVKYHIEADGSVIYLCPYERIDKCKLPAHRHVIICRVVIPEVPDFEMHFNVGKFGHLYNTDQIVKRHQQGKTKKEMKAN